MSAVGGRGFLLGLLLGCLVTVVAGVLLLRVALVYYREVNAVRLDPLGLRQIELGAVPEDLALVFYGDPRAAAWPEPVWLAGRTLNLGVNGQTSEQVLARFGEHLGGLYPEVVLLQVGINDLKAIPLFPEREEAIVERCKANIKRLVERFREKGVVVVLTTVFPLGEVPLERRLVWSERVEEAITEVNRYLELLAGDGVVLVSTEQVLADGEGELRPEFGRDLLHLSPAGYERLNEVLREVWAERIP